ncbi:MAG: large conductance mechanosensitive channel protein MscL [Parolsenella sp.]|uniref:large conductance mechanosensitive channel protein MscL n=1 Tax=Parolsenella sp. TaxID=2083006 RepID=UPI002A75331F|nr:large conductance mechanosensitive channel protein MscL [Parolsenella sp.]MCI5950665.1 large conductance mechanosensitive channel protein MscL [Coriobacteriaceae bacterium]MDY3292624.1 large conductance mechanosensitive channel protein MscL [Parolsenella sp.]
MKKLVKEFQEFISRGNVIDMAIGVIIGGAFTAIVTSLTEDIINPLIKLIAGGNVGEIGGLVVPGTEIDFGKFLGAIINFLIVAAIVFAIIKAFNEAQRLALSRVHTEEQPPAAPAPICPFCIEEHKPGATRCPHCGS